MNKEDTSMSETITFSPAPSVLGFGALNKLPEILGSRGVQHLLIITDSQIADSGILERVLDMLKGSIAWELFTGVPAEFRSSDIDAQKEHFGSDFDALLGLGGGSSMDFAKAMSILMTHGGSLGDYLGEGSVPDAVIPVICIPTTSGTGSQNTQTTVFTIAGVKRGVSSEYIRPAVSIVDPELTINLPPEVTRNSGYDALMHACESFIARPHAQVPERPILYQGSNPFSRSLSLEAFGFIWRSYRRAVSDGSDRSARLDMSTGSHLAGLAFSHSGLGLVHALASAVGGMVDAPHGVCLAACTNIGLSYNFKACEKDYAVLANSMRGIDEPAAANGGGEVFLEKIKDLIKALDFPSRPSELGLRKEDAEQLLENTLVQTRRTKTNPRPLDDELLSHIGDGI
jgi:alcohol dehydrogenase class IV